MIEKIDKLRTADRAMTILRNLHAEVKDLVNILQDNTRTITTHKLLQEVSKFQYNYNILNNIYNNYLAWFNSTFSDYATALTGARTSFLSINTIINNGLQANYWDTDKDLPLHTEISQEHRNALATAIDSELE